MKHSNPRPNAQPAVPGERRRVERGTRRHQFGSYARSAYLGPRRYAGNATASRFRFL